MPVGKSVDVVVVRNGAELADGDARAAWKTAIQQHSRTADAASQRRHKRARHGVFRPQRGRAQLIQVKESVKGVIVTSVEARSPPRRKGDCGRGDVDGGGQSSGGEHPSDVAKAIGSAKSELEEASRFFLVSNGVDLFSSRSR